MGEIHVGREDLVPVMSHGGRADRLMQSRTQLLEPLTAAIGCHAGVDGSGQAINSGVFVRFPHPESRGYNNSADVATDFGFEVQIDQLARDDGDAIHLTGAIYGFAAPTNPSRLPVKPPGEWNTFEIEVRGQTYGVTLNGTRVTHFVNTDNNRGLPSAAGNPSFIGLQTHTGRVAFRNIALKAL